MHDDTRDDIGDEILLRDPYECSIETPEGHGERGIRQKEKDSAPYLNSVWTTSVRRALAGDIVLDHDKKTPRVQLCRRK